MNDDKASTTDSGEIRTYGMIIRFFGIWLIVNLLSVVITELLLAPSKSDMALTFERC